MGAPLSPRSSRVPAARVALGGVVPAFVGAFLAAVTAGVPERMPAAEALPPARPEAPVKAEAPPEPRPDAPDAPCPLSISVRPRTVYVDGLVTARLRARELLGGDATIAWSASDGLLHWDDLPEIRWRAPPVPGPQVLEVSVRSAGREIAARLTIDVLAPSTEGMVWIPPGKFLCGDVEGTRDPTELKTVQNFNDEPFHEVYLDGYWIARHPVTNEDYVRFIEAAMKEGLARPETAAVMGEMDGEWVPFYYFKSYELILLDFFKRKNARRPFMINVISWDGERLRIKPGHEKHPVVDVSWFGSIAYANYYGLQLPSEAQWEKAARGTDGRRYPWGMRLPTPYHAPQAPDLALGPIGSFSPEGDSPYGVCEMLSGCFEWTNDWFNTEFYEDYYLPETRRNPAGTFWGRSRAIRGFPSSLLSTVEAVDRPAPITLRYEWIFDHMLGDCFGNRQSAFRTALCPSAPLGLISQGGGYRPVTTAEAAARSAAEEDLAVSSRR